MSQVLFIGNTKYTNKIHFCTLQENRCLKGEQRSDRIQKIKNIKNDYKKYFNYLENNSTIDCYVDKKNPKLIYLNNDSFLIYVIV